MTLTFSVVQWFALIFSIIALLKLLIILVSPRAWFKLEKYLYGKSSHVLMVLELILAIGLFYYLIKELTIVQIMASVVFGFLILGTVFASFSKETLKYKSIIIKEKHVITRAWIPILIIVLLSILTLIEIF